MIDLIIREATFDDAPALVPLLQQLGYPQTLDNIKERIRLYRTHNAHAVFVAELNKMVVGFISVAAIESFVKQGRMYRVTAIAVDQHSRRKGVGKALMRQVEELAKNSNGNLIDLTSGLRREVDGSHHFYKALGYQNDGYMAKLYLRKEIDT
jgi:GNAT superfamily N-acetyltransferase